MKKIVFLSVVFFSFLGFVLKAQAVDVAGSLRVFKNKLVELSEILMPTQVRMKRVHTIVTRATKEKWSYKKLRRAMSPNKIFEVLSAAVQTNDSQVQKNVLEVVIDLIQRYGSAIRKIYLRASDFLYAPLVVKNLDKDVQELREKLARILIKRGYGPEIYITLIEGDITTQAFDKPYEAAIVNAANSGLWGSAGIAKFIQLAAGGKVSSAGNALWDEIEESFKGVPRCPTGQARLTTGHTLDPLRIIHAVGPSLATSGNPTPQEKKELEDAFRSCLIIADEKEPDWVSSQVAKNEHFITRVGLVALSSGIFGYYSELSAPVAVNLVLNYLKENQSTVVREIRFITFGGYGGRDDYGNFKKALEDQKVIKLNVAKDIPKELTKSSNDVVTKPPVRWKVSFN